MDPLVIFGIGAIIVIGVIWISFQATKNRPDALDQVIAETPVVEDIVVPTPVIEEQVKVVKKKASAKKASAKKKSTKKVK